MSFLFCIVLSTLCLSCKSNSYIEQWTPAKYNFSVSDCCMVVGHKKNGQVIHIIGGQRYGKHIYEYNITSGHTTLMKNSLPQNIYVVGCNSYTTIDDVIYFYSQPLSVDKTNFFSYDMNTLVLKQIGTNYPKPTRSYRECYTSNHIDTVYLMGGIEGVGSNIFISFNIKTNKWIQGANMNTDKSDAACIYYNNTLFVFGGRLNSISMDIIEMLVLSSSNNKWKQLNVHTSTPTDRGRAYIAAKNSDNIFIVGNNICNIFNGNQLSIQLCPSMLFNASKFGAVYVPNLQRFYVFGGNRGVSNVYLNGIEYAINNYTIPIDFSQSTTNVTIGNRIPVLLSMYYDLNNSYIALKCSEINIDSLLTINSNSRCILCDAEKRNCHNCSYGIFPQFQSQINMISANGCMEYKLNVTADSEVINIINGFNVSVLPFINFSNSSTSISPGQTVPIQIFGIFQNNIDYQFVLYSSNDALKVNNILTIKTGNDAILNCTISTNNNPNTVPCNVGVLPLINYNFVSDKNHIFNISVSPNNNLSKNIEIIPSNGISVEISICSAGYGMVDLNTAHCELCAVNSFTLIAGTKPCQKCTQHTNGVVCKGGEQVIVDYNYWLSALTSNHSILYPFIDIKEDDTMFSVFCPPAFCCTQNHGCDYLKLYNHSNTRGLCAFGRNLSSPLCGQCEEGKSELFGSANCGKCRQTNYILIIFVFILIVIPFTIYITYFDSSPHAKK
eukprot:463757_1